MELISVNRGEERSLVNGKASGKTGIYKLPVSGAVDVTSLGIPGDAVVDKKNHGGADQAVYAYCSEDYAWWSKELGEELAPGTFGDNLTLSGCESADLHVGDILQIGEVRLQVTDARIPCKTLAARMGDPDFIQRFRQAERPGFYCRVLQEGTLQAGQTAWLEPYPEETVTIGEMFRDFYVRDASAGEIQRYLNAPIGSRSRADKMRQLERLKS
jgi:MOSC domain-containing protein YiiM